MAKSNTISPADVGGSAALAFDVVNALRLTGSLVMIKFSFLDAIPYLLVWATSREIAVECLRQYDEDEDPSTHHRVSREFCDPAGEMRRHMQVRIEGGGAYTPSCSRRSCLYRRFASSKTKSKGFIAA